MHQYVCVRTTVEIPDALLRKAKLAAVERGTTLRALVIRGLESTLSGTRAGGHRLTQPPVQLGADSPLRTMNVDDLARLDAETEAAELDEVYRRR